ncbi:IclR family transcriptional regulator [Glutamicibacter creatinolyticus]
MYVRKVSDSQTARVLWILAALAKVPQATVKELSEASQIPVSSVYRLLDDLVTSGFVHKTSSRHYGAGPVAVQLAERYRDTTMMTGTITPYLRQLSQDTGELAAFMVAHGAEAVCVESVEAARALRCSYTEGASQPLTFGASATALLAQLPPASRAEIFDFHALTETDRERIDAACAAAQAAGYAQSAGELDEGIWGVSAPVLDGAGELQGVVTLMAPIQRSQQRRAHLIEQTRRTAMNLSGGIK